jgi:acyl-CoA thioesterase II
VADSALPAVLQAESLGDDRFRFLNDDGDNRRDVFFGGQHLAQMIVVARDTAPDKHVKSIHTIFARPASRSADYELRLGRIHDGRAFANRTIDVVQGDRRCASALVLLDVDEADLLRHGPDRPDVGDPGDAVDVPAARGRCFPGSEVRVVDGVDTYDPELPPGPAEMLVWTRYPGSTGDRTLSQAVLSFGTDGHLIGTAMRPHEIREGAAHNSVSTGVVSHTLTFHEPFDCGDWLLIAHESPYAGRGRVYGRAHVFSEDGRVVASFVQEAIVRNFPPGQDYEGKYRTVM